MLFDKFLFEFNYFYAPNKLFFRFKLKCCYVYSQNFIWIQIFLLKLQYLFKFENFFVFWQIFILIEIFCLNVSPKLRSSRRVSYHSALKWSCSTLKLHILALSIQQMICYYSLLAPTNRWMVVRQSGRVILDY